jgi:hypothetical protein
MMVINQDKAMPLLLMARSAPQAGDLVDPRAFAWEILRRRKDYRGMPASIERLADTAAPIDLIRPADAPSRWGLRFRRRS